MNNKQQVPVIIPSPKNIDCWANLLNSGESVLIKRVEEGSLSLHRADQLLRGVGIDPPRRILKKDLPNRRRVNGKVRAASR